MEDIKQESEVVEEVKVEETEKVEEIASPSSDSVEPTEDNAFIKVLKALGKYLYGIGYNIVDAFRYNNCLLPGLLILLPGLFIGFFLGVHSSVLFLTKPDESDFSGLLMFVLVLFGCINIFSGVTFISKKNLGTAITSTICSSVITVCGGFWIQKIFYSQWLLDNNIIKLSEDQGPVKAMDKYAVISIIAVVLAVVCSLAGCIMAYFTRNKNYKKVKF
ncbi:MAG: hypothetical protein K2H02_05075 [Anaeroplasmataceae bacterium]|nr:hypothetical protein [Anaeroplasmataceae bacterium]MDE5868299.1 hypothetical protein [Anaeroplasmataceae bacterium]